DVGYASGREKHSSASNRVSEITMACCLHGGTMSDWCKWEDLEIEAINGSIDVDVTFVDQDLLQTYEFCRKRGRGIKELKKNENISACGYERTRVMLSLSSIL
ncbi:unnamed protein product, partial [Sphenostylis stenocarpa]